MTLQNYFDHPQYSFQLVQPWCLKGSCPHNHPLPSLKGICTKVKKTVFQSSMLQNWFHKTKREITIPRRVYMCSGVVLANTMILLYFASLMGCWTKCRGPAIIFLHFPNFTTFLHPRIFSKDTALQIIINRVCAKELPNSFSRKITPTVRDVSFFIPGHNTGGPGLQMPPSVLLEVTGWDSRNRCLNQESYHRRTSSFFRPCYFPAWLWFQFSFVCLFVCFPLLLVLENSERGVGGKKKEKQNTKPPKHSNRCFENSTAQSA